VPAHVSSTPALGAYRGKDSKDSKDGEDSRDSKDSKDGNDDKERRAPRAAAQEQPPKYASPEEGNHP
jgi:hypothetical protein